MIRSAMLMSLAASALCAALAFADPAFRVVYSDGIPRVEISGDWAGSSYTVVRASSPAGEYLSLLSADALCTGECYAVDLSAQAGTTYWYRFDLVLPDGSAQRFGPYAATISPELATRIGARVSPNPVHGSATLRLVLAGARGAAPIATTLALYDIGGRRVSMVQQAALAPGVMSLTWQPRDDRGARLAAGRYLLRFSAADGRRSVTRVTVVR